MRATGRAFITRSREQRTLVALSAIADYPLYICVMYDANAEAATPLGKLPVRPPVDGCSIATSSRLSIPRT